MNTLDQLERVHPRFSRLHQERGMAYVARRDAPNAIQNLLVSVNINPALPASWSMLEGLYRMTGDRRFATRATQEMLAAAAYPSWYPAHFLDTAETTTALGIGYDWLYNTLSPADRQTIRQALVSKSLDPWLALIASGKAHYNNNWSQVCNGGETIGVFGDYDVDGTTATSKARAAKRRTMISPAPDRGR